MYIYVCKIWRNHMSVITSLSIREENRNQYSAMRNWLKQKNMSMGDYLISKWNDEFQGKVHQVLTK